MSLVSVLLAAFVALAPGVGFAVLLPRGARYRKEAPSALATLACGAVFYAPAYFAERALERWTGIDARASFGSDVSVIIYSFFMAAPLEQGMTVAAVVPVLRSRHWNQPIDGITYAAAAAIGFASAHNAVYLATAPPSAVGVLRAVLAVPAHVFLASAWGYALGRDRGKRLGSRQFNAAWLGAMLFGGVADHLLFARLAGGLVAVVPLIACMGFVALLGARDLIRRGDKAEDRVRFRISAPSIASMRDALRRSDRPVMMKWIAFGALVTTGVMTATLAGSVALGQRLGIDFAAVDRVDTAGTATAPLLLLGSAALAAFPIAGYLVARASSARTVLEPAMSAALAIGGSLVLLGLAAPVAVVFAIAFAPIAFGLACAGAWVALER